MLSSYLEVPDKKTVAAYDRADRSELRKRLFCAIVDQGYPGSILEDISLVPRVLPGSFLRRVETVCIELTEALLTLASRDKQFIIRCLKPDGRWSKLIHEHRVLDECPRRMIGELRYDFALAGPLDEAHPPLLMEVNAGALGGVVYGSFIPRVLKKIVPGLEHLEVIDLAENFISLCERIGPNVANFTLGEYSWGEDVLYDAAHGRYGFHLVSPRPPHGAASFWPKLKPVSWRFSSKNRLALNMEGEWREMDGFRWSRILEHEDIDRYGSLLRQVQTSDTVFLSPLRMDFVGHKGVLPLLHNRRFLGGELGLPNPDVVARSLPWSRSLADVGFPPAHCRRDFVLKGNFGCSGKKVYVGDAIEKMEHRVDDPDNWVLQERLELNHMLARTLYGQTRPLRMDLGVFVHYDYQDGRLEHCKVVGLLSRGSQRYRVNLNLGGVCMPVLMDPAR